MPHVPSHSKLNILIFLICAALWSGSFIAIKMVVAVWPPVFGAAVRVGIALAAIALLTFIKQQKLPSAFLAHRQMMLVGVFAQALPFATLFWGEQYVSPGLAGIMNATVSIWTYLLALIFLPQKTTFTFYTCSGLMLGLIGVIVIFTPLLSFDYHPMFLYGSLAVLSMAISYAISNILNQYVLHGENTPNFLSNLYYQHCGSFLFLFLIVILSAEAPSSSHVLFNTKAIIASLYLGLFSTALAYALYYHLIREWDAVHASSVLYIIPALTLLWDYLLDGIIPTRYQCIGIVIILLGVAMIQAKKLLPAKKLV